MVAVDFVVESVVGVGFAVSLFEVYVVGDFELWRYAVVRAAELGESSKVSVVRVDVGFRGHGLVCRVW